MNKQKILNWIGGIWFAVNLPIIPFAGSLVYAFLAEYFSNPSVPFASFAFGVFIIILILSKAWINKYLNAPVILSLLVFLFAALQLVIVQDFLVRHRPLLLWGIFIVLVGIICIAVVKAMRGELNKKI